MPFRIFVWGYPGRLFATQSLAFTLNIAEEAVCFTIYTGSEEEFVGWARDCIITELQGPQAIDRDGISILVSELTEKRTRIWIERIDVTIAEVTDQQVIAELAKVSRCQGQTPGRVEATACNEATNQIPTGVEDIDKPITRTRYIVVLGSIPLRKRDVEVASDVLDAERCKTLRKTLIGEGAYEFKIRVEHLDGSEAEIGGKDKRSRGIAANSQSFVDRALTYIRSIHCQDGMRLVGESRVPAGYRAIFGIKNEYA